MKRRSVRGRLVLLAVSLGCTGAGSDRGASAVDRLPGRVDSLINLADSTVRQAPDSAIRLYRVALAAASQPPDDSANIARAMAGLGMAARLTGDWTQARQMGELALALKLRLNMPDREIFQSYNALGLLAWYEERLGDATALMAKASEYALKAGDSVAQGKVRVNEGLIAKDQGAFERARHSLETGRDIARATGDSVTLGRALNNLGMLDIALGAPISAVASLEEARRLARFTGDNLTEVNARGQLANAYQALGEPQRAFALLDSALVMAQQQGQPTEVAENLTILADLYVEAGDYQHALDYYRRAQLMTDSLGLPEERGDILRSAARAQAAVGNMDLATAQAREALRIHREGGFQFPELEDLLVLANIAVRRQRLAEAEGYLGDARRLASAIDAPIAQAVAAIATADVAARSRQWDRVLQVLAGSSGTLHLAGRTAEAEAFTLQAQALSELGRPEAALVAGGRAIAAVEEIRENYGTPALRTTFTSQKAELFARQALLMLRLGRTNEALEVADAARGRALIEHLLQARDDVRASTPVNALIEREALLRRIDVLVNQLRERERTSPTERSGDFVTGTVSLRDSVEGLRSEYAALLARSGADRAATDRWSAALETRPAVSDIVRSLEPDELLLEFLVTDDRLLLFAVSPGGVTSHVVHESAVSLAGRVQLARDLLRSRESEMEARVVLRALFDVVLGPVSRSGEMARAGRLIIVPHGVLTYLPFAALVNGTTGRWVAQDHDITQVATSAVLPLLRRQPDDAPGLVRAEVFAPVPDALRATRDEAESVARALPGARKRMGAAASEAGFRAALTRGSVVHVATHAMLNRRNPLFTQIEFAGSARGPAGNNGRLELHELLGMKANASLVFLSGCETAVGSSWSTQFETGEDFATLGQAFLMAGARNVVATLWRIDDAGAAEFARHFYANLSLGYTKALSAAQRRMIASEQYRSPYFWAAYQISGSGLGPLRKGEAVVR